MHSKLSLCSALLALMGVTSCSLFSSSKQNIQVYSNDSNADLYCDGKPLGKGSAVVKVYKNRGHFYEARNGNKNAMAVTSSELSTTGVLDIIGGVIILLPFLGFCSKGAFEQDSEIVSLSVK